jgi:hypothetical protein
VLVALTETHHPPALHVNGGIELHDCGES